MKVMRDGCINLLIDRMKNVMRTVLLMLVIGYMQSCKQDPKVELEPGGTIHNPISKKVSFNDNLNISVLIDLSDRIDPKKHPSPAMEFYMRDIGYLESVANSFEWHLLYKKVIHIDDKIQVFMDPEPSDQSLNKKVTELKTHFTKVDVDKDSILRVSDKYGTISKTIYEAAIADNNYVGSDIWGFFKNKVDDYCVDEGYRNILVILTDGYMFHKDSKMEEDNQTSYLTPQFIQKNSLNKSDWQKRINEKDFGFIVPKKDLSNLDVLVLGINPVKGNPYEEDVIRAYWSKWLSELKVNDFEIKQADLPSHMDKIIRDFILKK
ncbi:hypothetical protein [Flagellimonas sp.]|uniref:hypothetical protein n=1 Tax=Flagellimonas sp. TaxID=2058762 RepID=UPI003AB65DDA